MFQLDTAARNSKNRKTDIILVLKPQEGKNTLNNIGLTDNRLFTGENKLHAIMDTQTCLWYLKYDIGILPPQLKQRFTSYSTMLRFVTEYFKRRNIDIVDIID